ncbi:hypothetical protein F5Y04DRAFT_253278 [Hypomontagnella monticulosa]|nr:hypothetical protein F5Y04DRAFT_253278 [Hypomontagnella monticulosa]
MWLLFALGNFAAFLAAVPRQRQGDLYQTSIFGPSLAVYPIFLDDSCLSLGNSTIPPHRVSLAYTFFQCRSPKRRQSQPFIAGLTLERRSRIPSKEKMPLLIPCLLPVTNFR